MLGQEKTRELLEQELERLRNENHRLKEELTSLKEKETNQSFKEKYAVRILESLPDMLTVFNHEGTGIGVVPVKKPIMWEFPIVLLPVCICAT